MSLLLWIQDLSFSTWIRESDWALFAFLIVHTVAIGFLVGAALLTTLCVFTKSEVLRALIALRPSLWLGLFAAIASGILLVMGYPAKALTNPWFYLKMSLIITGVTLSQKVLSQCASESAINSKLRTLATIHALTWLCALTVGKFLAYTNTVLLVY